MKPLQAVSFDFDGTLFDHERASRLALAAVCRVERVSFERFLPVFHKENLLMWDAYGRGEIDSGTIRAGRFQRTLARLGLDATAAERWAEAYLRIYERLPFLIDGAFDIVRRLSGRVRLAIVTNGYTDVQRAKLEATGLRTRIDVLVTSEDAGAAKPSRESFLRAASLLKAPLGSILHVGDSLEGDVRGALAAGMKAAWFCRGGMPAEVPAGIDVVTDLRAIAERCDLPPGPPAA